MVSGISEKHIQGDFDRDKLLSHTYSRIISDHQTITHIQSKLLVRKISAAAGSNRVPNATFNYSLKFAIRAHTR